MADSAPSDGSMNIFEFGSSCFSEHPESPPNGRVQHILYSNQNDVHSKSSPLNPRPVIHTLTRETTQFALQLLALLPLTLALTTPAEFHQDRATCAYTCGSVCYYQSDVDEAVAQGYADYKAGKQVGSNDYPHTENNYENIDFYVSGPYEEFPILKTYKVYTGGSPGPDRVVFKTNGQLAGVVTHTGASGNDFVPCTGCC